MGLDTIIIVVFVVAAVIGLVVLQRSGSKKGTEPPAAPKK